MIALVVARAVPLRDKDTYSVVLARFVNEGFGQIVTLAEVFWLRDLEGQPEPTTTSRRSTA